MGKKFREWKDIRLPWDREKRTFRSYRQMIHTVKRNAKRIKKFMRIRSSLPYHLRTDFSMDVKVLKKLYSEKEMKGYTGNLRNFRENPPDKGVQQ